MLSTAEGSVLAPSVCGFCLCVKYLGSRLTDLCQIHMEDMFGPVVPRSDEFEGQRHQRQKMAFFSPFGGLLVVYVWWNIFSL